MIGLNEELRERANANHPVKIGLIGAGQMGVDVAAAVKMMKGVDVVAAADINIERARNAYSIAGLEGPVVEAKTSTEADAAVLTGKRVYTRDYRVVCGMKSIDVMLESTGVPEIGARAALRSARSGRQLAMMNVETDITVGPVLRWYAEKKGVLYALAAGDEPAACKELYDFADALGFTIVAAGKGKNNPLDRHAKPTDEKWAKESARRGLSPNMLVEFVDGSKTMIEMAAVSNATGLVPDVRGMHGPSTTRDQLNRVFALKEHGGVLNRTGVVDFGIGGIHPGVFVIVKTDHPRLRQALVYRDMGDGPYYTLFRPYHLCSIEVPLTAAQAVIYGESSGHPLAQPVAECIAIAKRPLKAGQTLDAIGERCYRGSIDTVEAVRREDLLPLGLAKGCVLARDVALGEPIRYDDLESLPDSPLVRMRRESACVSSA